MAKRAKLKDAYNEYLRTGADLFHCMLFLSLKLRKAYLNFLGRLPAKNIACFRTNTVEKILNEEDDGDISPDAPQFKYIKDTWDEYNKNDVQVALNGLFNQIAQARAIANDWYNWSNREITTVFYPSSGVDFNTYIDNHRYVPLKKNDENLLLKTYEAAPLNELARKIYSIWRSKNEAGIGKIFPMCFGFYANVYQEAAIYFDYGMLGKIFLKFPNMEWIPFSDINDIKRIEENLADDDIAESLNRLSERPPTQPIPTK